MNLLTAKGFRNGGIHSSWLDLGFSVVIPNPPRRTKDLSSPFAAKHNLRARLA